ncbi:hypothetical protein [Jeotgalibacillus haloalkalitolerans]|uniref:IDEAL domain-containing protein n=1 Tax=Jeotgalibacillus haloalkalitolerans TaxID=3104292 RepID=A0ABU5KLY0_9BACL|nr:hypothetical protein [Jeotgalibacillus sp. HH7-29]MDZ5712268.1 hypothetical protein [Jeotgalibacillus sp. HH7-29]
MYIQELFERAIKTKDKKMALTIDYLLNEKQVAAKYHDYRTLYKYVKDKNIPRLNKLLNEYLKEKRTDADWVLYELFNEEGEENEIMEPLKQREDA